MQVVIFLGSGQPIKGFVEIVRHILDFFWIPFFQRFRVTDFSDVLKQAEKFFYVFGQYNIFLPLNIQFKLVYSLLLGTEWGEGAVPEARFWCHGNNRNYELL